MGIDDVKRAYTLFLDEQQSTSYLKSIQDKFMFDEEEESSKFQVCLSFLTFFSLQTLKKNKKKFSLSLF